MSKKNMSELFLRKKYLNIFLKNSIGISLRLEVLKVLKSFDLSQTSYFIDLEPWDSISIIKEDIEFNGDYLINDDSNFNEMLDLIISYIYNDYEYNGHLKHIGDKKLYAENLTSFKLNTNIITNYFKCIENGLIKFNYSDFVYLIFELCLWSCIPASVQFIEGLINDNLNIYPYDNLELTDSKYFLIDNEKYFELISPYFFNQACTQKLKHGFFYIYNCFIPNKFPIQKLINYFLFSYRQEVI